LTCLKAGHDFGSIFAASIFFQVVVSSSVTSQNE
jgi:hypothetical protein